MRLNFYEFPEAVDAKTRFQNGAQAIEGGVCKHKRGRNNCRDCTVHDGIWTTCPHFIPNDVENVMGGISVTRAKQLLRQFGGSAWTDHFERNGGFIETTPIELTGNNSKFKYNRHL